MATRSVAGPGEVLLNVRGSKEAYLAWSDQPLPRGTEVLVIDIRGAPPVSMRQRDPQIALARTWGRDTATKRIAEIGENEGRSWPRRQLRG